ncbi:probable cytochrome P450 6a13 [Nasonia vitripennis]|uniref:Cytochrome P450 n=1 Tax=Nasonia vitripennis TaxID=7425 RepID=A0A7M7T8F1_NASVI|nr:probable cytochrome P450 6a13 [Nasonia vitripennis]
MVEATAQAYLLFIAGFETTTSVVSYCLLEMALNPDIQEKLQQEIDEVAERNGFTHNALMEMEYLNMKVSGSGVPEPLVRQRLSDYVIPKGMPVVISTLGVHYDPKHFPNPHKFDPTRFSKENSVDRSPYVNLAFGEGPRNCIGKRFGTLQSKLAIARLLHNYKFYISQNTVLPVKFTSESFFVSPDHKLTLRFEHRRK